jgi:hypothetical protein
VQNDINILVQSFFDHTLNLTKINYTFIISISKNKEGNTSNSYKPMNLISVRTTTKILASRISVVIDNLIDNSQITFIKNRNTHDNIICAQKILFKVRKNKRHTILS